MAFAIITRMCKQCVSGTLLVSRACRIFLYFRWAGREGEKNILASFPWTSAVMSNLIGSFNIKHMTSCIPTTIASVKDCVHDGVLRYECDICSYFNGLQKTSNHGRRCLTLLAEDKQRQHLDTLASDFTQCAPVGSALKAPSVTRVRQWLGTSYTNDRCRRHSCHIDQFNLHSIRSVTCQPLNTITAGSRD